MKKVNILGTDYICKFVTNSDSPDLDGCGGGITKFFKKQIIINTANDEIEDLKRIIRHEVIHAFLFECGLSDYASDEKIVDFLAYQIPKIMKISKEVEEYYEEQED